MRLAAIDLWKAQDDSLVLYNNSHAEYVRVFYLMEDGLHHFSIASKDADIVCVDRFAAMDYVPWRKTVFGNFKFDEKPTLNMRTAHSTARDFIREMEI